MTYTSILLTHKFSSDWIKNGTVKGNKRLRVGAPSNLPIDSTLYYMLFATVG